MCGCILNIYIRKLNVAKYHWNSDWMIGVRVAMRISLAFNHEIEMSHSRYNKCSDQNAKKSLVVHTKTKTANAQRQSGRYCIEYNFIRSRWSYLIAHTIYAMILVYIVPKAIRNDVPAEVLCSHKTLYPHYVFNWLHCISVFFSLLLHALARRIHGRRAHTHTRRGRECESQPRARGQER